MRSSQSAADQQIVNLIHCYANYVDEGRFADVAELFGRAHVVMGDRVLTGRNAAEAIRQSLLSDDDPGATQHAMSNIVIEIDVARMSASASTRYTVYRETSGGPELLITGTYVDTFGRVEHDWHFTRREYRLGLLGARRLHLRPAQ